MAGVDLRTVQPLGGWQSLAMVQRYAHLAPDHLRAAVERLVRATDRWNLDRTWTCRQQTGSLLAALSCKILIVLRGGVAEPG